MKPSIYAVKTETLGKLFIMPKPSGEWLSEDIAHYNSLGITEVISLLRDDEIHELALEGEIEVCNAAGIGFKRLPIQDRGLPEIIPLRFLAKEAAKQIDTGSSIAVHCRAGIGRAGLLVCCILQELGFGAVQALTDVSEARGVRVPDTPEQRDFIIDYGKAS